jgi:cytochrome-b5 reductase
LRIDLGEGNTMGITTAGLVMVAGVKRDGTTGAKPYTPTTRDNTVGHMDLVVKDYPEGNISRHICSLKVGDEIKIKGPFTKRAMNANEKKEIGMIVGGSGLTPALQVSLGTLLV